MRKCCRLQRYSQQCSEKRCSLQSCLLQCSETRCSLHDFRDADASFISPALLFAPVFSFGGNSVRIANEGHSPEEHPG